MSQYVTAGLFLFLLNTTSIFQLGTATLSQVCATWFASGAGAACYRLSQAFFALRKVPHHCHGKIAKLTHCTRKRNCSSDLACSFHGSPTQNCRVCDVRPCPWLHFLPWACASRHGWPSINALSALDIFGLLNPESLLCLSDSRCSIARDKPTSWVAMVSVQTSHCSERQQHAIAERALQSAIHSFQKIDMQRIATVANACLWLCPVSPLFSHSAQNARARSFSVEGQ